MVDRAFRVLDALSTAADSLSMSELARTLAMGKSSMHGLLKTLEATGAIMLDESRRYTLGPRIFELAQAYTRQDRLRPIALPAMRRLAAEIGETILLGTVERDAIRIIERVEARDGRRDLRISAERGTRVPLLAAATGRIVLGEWAPERRAEYLREHPLPQYTPHSQTSPADFLRSVAETERTGIGVDHEEYLIGVNAVAAAIRDVENNLAGVLWVVGFSVRFSGDVLNSAGSAILEEANAVSRALGAPARPRDA